MLARVRATASLPLGEDSHNARLRASSTRYGAADRNH